MHITPIKDQIENRPFVVTVQFHATDWATNLTYRDDKGLDRLIPPTAIHPATSLVRFTHPGLPVGKHTVSIIEPKHNVNLMSNVFSVIPIRGGR